MANHREELLALQRRIRDTADELVDTDPIALRDLAYEAASALSKAAARESAIQALLTQAEADGADSIPAAAIEEALGS